MCSVISQYPGRARGDRPFPPRGRFSSWTRVFLDEGRNPRPAVASLLRGGFRLCFFPLTFLETLFLCAVLTLHWLEIRLGRGISLISEHWTLWHEAIWTPIKAGTLRRICSTPPLEQRILLMQADPLLKREQAPASASSSCSQIPCETAETHCWKEEIVCCYKILHAMFCCHKQCGC